jgi:hypothetical protein
VCGPKMEARYQCVHQHDAYGVRSSAEPYASGIMSNTHKTQDAAYRHNPREREPRCGVEHKPQAP